jgi:hypothetical protein
VLAAESRGEYTQLSRQVTAESFSTKMPEDNTVSTAAHLQSEESSYRRVSIVLKEDLYS